MSTRMRPIRENSPNGLSALDSLPALTKLNERVWREMAPLPSDLVPQPVEIDLSGSRTLPTPSVSESVKWWANLPQPHELLQLGESGTSIRRDPLAQWYAGNDGPWVPKGIEIDGIPHSDSGYGSRRNVENGSVFRADLAERDPDYQGLIGHSTSESARLVCTTCNKSVKTRSELKKHHLRHTKPFNCKISGCLRIEGFRTTNDLVRHIRSKHPQETSAKPGDKPPFSRNPRQPPSLTPPKVAAFAAPLISDLFTELEKTKEVVRDQSPPISEDRTPVVNRAEPLENNGVSPELIAEIAEKVKKEVIKHLKSGDADYQPSSALKSWQGLGYQGREIQPKPSPNPESENTDAPGYQLYEVVEIPQQLSDQATNLQRKPIPNPAREVTKGANGRFWCTWVGCTEEIRDFGRKCEWTKHMDKHDRPYNCYAEGCEKLPSHADSGGLLRHEREVQQQSGAARKPLYCPFSECRHHSQIGFTRKDILNKHIRRIHSISTVQEDINIKYTGLLKPYQARNENIRKVLAPSMGYRGAATSPNIGIDHIISRSSATSTNGRPRENKRKVLRVHIKGKEHISCPDSGSEMNIMSETFAKEHGFKIRRGAKDLKRFELGSGKSVWSVGRVRVPVELFRNPLSRNKCSFYVLPNCPVQLIFGMKFLKDAEILTKNRHMLETCPTEVGNISSLLWIGSPRNRMKCSLDGHNLVSVADTGSDLNFMSLKCAKREGFHIDRSREARTRVQVGDGTETETIGQVYVHSVGLDWRKAETGSTDDHPRVNMGDPLDSAQAAEDSSEHEEDPGTFGAIFHVLPGLPCDVIFGRDLLDDTDAFNLCPELFSSPPSEPDDPFELNVLISLGPVSLNIPISRRSRRVTVVAPDPKEVHDDARHAEMFRRSNREDEIALLPTEKQQDRARVREKMRVREWAVGHFPCDYCNPV